VIPSPVGDANTDRLTSPPGRRLASV